MDAVFIDLDGTLLDDHHHISLKNLNALKRLENLNIPYFIATGRPEQLVKKILFDLTYERMMILYNGSVVGQPFKQPKLFSKALDTSVVQTILSYALAHQYLVMLYTEHAIYSDNNERVQYFKNFQKSDPTHFQTTFKPFDAYHGETVYKILVVEHDQTRYHTFQNYLEDCPVQMVQSQKGFLDINPLGTSKGEAITHIIEHFGYKREYTIAFGDQENDLSMVDAVGKFIAMGNAVEKVKQAAHMVTTSNNDSGVAHALEKLKLI